MFGHTRDQGGRDLLSGLEIGYDAIQSSDTQLRPRVRSNKKSGFSGFKNPYYGFAILTMTKSKHLKTDFNAEKSVVGFPFFARFFFEEIEEKDLKTVLKKEQRSHLHLQIFFFSDFPITWIKMKK